MTEHRFDTPTPVDLYVEIGKGSVRVHATQTATTHLRIDGRDADRVAVQQDGDRISVIGPKDRPGFPGVDTGLTVRVDLPAESNVAARTGSAAVEVEGPAAAVNVRTGSGDVRVDALAHASAVETGSGDVRVDDARGALKVKSGSGAVQVDHAAEDVVVSTGSGDVSLGTTLATVAVKTGSGDLTVGDAHGDVTLATASGDLSVGRVRRGKLTTKAASGDVRVGVPAGLPVWTDIHTVSGEIRSSLPPAGAPREGQEHLELRAVTVSGDITLVPA